MAKSNVNHPISKTVLEFIVSKRSRRLSPRTIQFYEDELRIFQKHLADVKVANMEDVTADVVRRYLLKLGETRNQGGMHCGYRVVKTFLFFFEREYEDTKGKNPIHRVEAPKISHEPIPGVPLSTVQALMRTCDRKTMTGQRDRAILITLVDSGLRRNELISLNYDSIDFKTGTITVLGKGNKIRQTHIGFTARKEILRYLRFRPDITGKNPLFASDEGRRLSASGLREILRRRCVKLGIPEISPHDFRRTFALERLRRDPNIYTLMHDMGHTTPTVLMRYLHLVEGDMQESSERGSPGDAL